MLIGGSGNDTFVVDTIGDQVIELAGGGTDTVQSSVTLTLAANVENLILTGVDAISGTGNELANVLTGNAGANTLTGGDGNDTLDGGAGNDTLDGGAGDDILNGGEGNDLVYGGAGRDTLLLKGASLADYTVRIENGKTVFSHLNGGAGGTDTVADVETLRFTDPVLSPDLSADATITRLYESLLNRAPDPAGKALWLEAHANGMSMHDIANSFVNSAEAQQLYGVMSDEGFVDMLYHTALHREADAGGRALWTGALENHALDRADVLLGFANSTEKLTQKINDAADLDFNLSEAATLVRLYDALLNRHPDQGGINGWLAANDAGMSTHDISFSFVNSAEAQQLHGVMSDEGFVDMLYQTALNREADAGGRALWTGALENHALDRADVLLGFANSAEHMQLVGVITTSIETI